MVRITVERYRMVNDRMIGDGRDDNGARVIFAPDKATYIMTAPFLVSGTYPDIEVEEWRILHRS